MGFTASDREDLEQEMMTDLFQRLPRFDPKRAGRNTFIARVVEHKIATLIEARKAGMRDYRRCTWSLNDPLEDEDGYCLERLETIDQEDYLRRTGSLLRPAAEREDLALDVHRGTGKARARTPRVRPAAGDQNGHRDLPETPGFLEERSTSPSRNCARPLEKSGLRKYL